MNTLSTILNVVLGSGIVGLLLFYGSRKRQANAEADVSQFNALAMQVKHFSTQLSEAYAMNDDLQDIVDRQRCKLVELSKELANLRVQLIHEQEMRMVAERDKCTRQGCAERVKPVLSKESNQQD